MGLEGMTMTKAKLFTTGGSQAVRLPANFRFEGDEVEIRRDPVTGDVVLSKPIASWDEYFDWVRTLDLPRDFLKERDQSEDGLRDPLPGSKLPRRRRG
jgi:antitoxin VapB